MVYSDIANTVRISRWAPEYFAQMKVERDHCFELCIIFVEKLIVSDYEGDTLTREVDAVG